MRATLRLSSPAWLAQPMMTSAMDAGSMAGLRCIRLRIAWAARSSARIAESEPVKLPIGVRMPSMMYALVVTGENLRPRRRGVRLSWVREGCRCLAGGS